MKKNNGIQIQVKNTGTFTKYCKSKGYNGVTKECIKEGCKSKNKTTKKRACFAKNFAK